MAIDLQQIGKRFRFYTNLKELEMEDLKAITGSTEETLNNIINGCNILLDELVAIVKHFDDLNPQWLIYGEGSMFKPMDADGNCHEPSKKGCLKKDKAAYLRQMKNMLIELEAAEIAKGHKPDVDALRAKLDELRAAQQ
ncbi:hypothetical protein C8N40_101150 [Pontibacter mucosus]|uniref:Uncharacterized protein n=2 Tax=Pontibacter TaxID=323449 RepID=A0A1I2TI98_9BACT|nr:MULTISPECIES: hypothetical protein [Pontibacter]PTX22327.1 hypothetical protein C8N40_101150 [Pontibacter mucosus]SFG64598.1 hypothetical protein SAMN05421739_103152 [Pontibacter chinhatensis]